MTDRRVVITGFGAISSIGNNNDEVLASLQQNKSGICYSKAYEEHNFRSKVEGKIDLEYESKIDRKFLRFMSPSSAYCYLASLEALEQAKLKIENIANNPRIGLIVGAGGTSTENLHVSWNKLEAKGRTKYIGPYMVPRIMSSGISACLSTFFKIQGVNYSISSACSTSAHCIGSAYEQILLNNQDLMLAGGGEELHWTLSCFFDAMGALSSKYNDTPTKASRTYDKDRDGFVISGGGGIVILEELNSAKKRGAKIFAEVVGYGATSDGYDMVQPSGEGAIRAIKLANPDNQKIDYINTHGTSTMVGDITELQAIEKALIGQELPKISSTKSQTGHALGAAGALETIYTLLMMNNNFISASANIENLDDGAKGFPIITKPTSYNINQAMSNSFGFGGTNASLRFNKYQE